jgi:hypothetical protein
MGLHSFRVQLNLSSSVHRVTQLNPQCVLDLLKLRSNVNECEPLIGGWWFRRRRRRRRRRERRNERRGARRSGRLTPG